MATESSIPAQLAVVIAALSMLLGGCRGRVPVSVSTPDPGMQKYSREGDVAFAGAHLYGWRAAREA